MTDYVALQGIQAPGTSVYGYQRGDRVHEDVVRNWNLRVDHDVAEGTELPPEEQPTPLDRPGPEATRADWEKWAVLNGMTPETASAASQDDLEATGPKDEPAVDQQGDIPARPADSAKKDAWIDYVVASGGDEQWARADSTTKGDLQGWSSPVGDTVAVAATDANQG